MSHLQKNYLKSTLLFCTFIFTQAIFTADNTIALIIDQRTEHARALLHDMRPNAISSYDLNQIESLVNAFKTHTSNYRLSIEFGQLDNTSSLTYQILMRRAEARCYIDEYSNDEYYYTVESTLPYTMRRLIGLSAALTFLYFLSPLINEGFDQTKTFKQNLVNGITAACLTEIGFQIYMKFAIKNLKIEIKKHEEVFYGLSSVINTTLRNVHNRNQLNLDQESLEDEIRNTTIEQSPYDIWLEKNFPNNSNPSDEKLAKCSICLNPLNQEKIPPQITTSCGHTYHAACFVKLIQDGTNPSCPICRKDFYS